MKEMWNNYAFIANNGTATLLKVLYYLFLVTIRLVLGLNIWEPV